MYKAIKLVTHENPHVDECAAIYVLQMYAKILKEMDVQSVTEIGHSLIENPEENTIYIGVGGGKYDDHSFDGHYESKKQGKKVSSVELVGKNLLGFWGSPEYPAVNHIMRYAHTNDVKGSKMKMELGKLLKDKFNTGQTLNMVYPWVQNIFDNRIYAFTNKEEFKVFVRELRNPQDPRELLHLKKSFSIEKQNVSRIVLRKNFNFNDVVAVKLAQRWGEEYFGKQIRRARIEFVDPAEYSFKEGDLCIGFGDADFSHFPAKKMQFLLKRSGSFKVILDYIDHLNRMPLQGNYFPFELANLLADQLFVGEEPWDVFKWASAEINTLCAKQRQFFNAQRMFDQARRNRKDSRVQEIFLGASLNKPLTFNICVIDGIDERMITHIAFAKTTAKIIVSRNSRGQVVILTRDNKYHPYDLSSIVKELRIQEMIRRGIQPEAYEKLELRAEDLTLCPEWHYQKETESCYNGSFTHTDIDPTMIPLEDIVEIVQDDVERYIAHIEKRYDNKQVA